MRKIKYLFLFILILIGCTKLTKKTHFYLKLISKFKVQDIYSPELCAAKDKIFVTNSYKSTDGKIYVYDYNGNLLKTFGSKGKRPGEFEFIVHIFYNYTKKLLGIYDLNGFKILYFDNNFKFINSVSTSKVFLQISAKIEN